MNEEKIESLIEKLDMILGVDGVMPSVSPTPSSSGEKSPDILITKDSNFDRYDKSQLLYIHALLHKFYGSGHRDLSKPVIEQLHKEIKTKINHKNFDRLDK